MKKWFTLFILLISFNNFSQAQIAVRGVVLDTITKAPLNPVSIENLRTHQNSVSNSEGFFSIEAQLGDEIVFTHVGYRKKIITLKMMDKADNLKVLMDVKVNTLRPVVIKSGLSEYQKDSVERAEVYKDVFEYDQQTSVFSPVTSLYQKFSKKHKNIRKFKDQIIQNEQQKFIDTRYTPELVSKLTGLQDDERASFMNQYPMDYAYARAATELEIKMWVKYNYQDYVKKGKPPYVPKVEKK